MDYGRYTRGGSVWLTVLVTLIGCSAAESNEEPEVEVSWTEVQTITGAEEAPESLLNQPRSLSLHPEGYVVVADAQPARVLVYRSDGSFYGTIGSEGQGPGEYEDISELFVTADGLIAVQDRMSRRFQWFDIDGQVVHALTPPQMPLHMEPQEQGYLATTFPRRDSLMFFYADEEMRMVGEPFGPLHEWIDWDDPITRVSFSPRPPVMLNNRLFVVPRYYGGQVFTMERVEEAWTHPRVISGVPVARAYDVREGMQRGEGLRMFTSTDEGLITVIPENVSLGLEALPQGYVIHVLALSEGAGYVLGAAVYDAEGTYLGFTELNREDDASLPGLAFRLHDVDDEGQLYFTDTRTASVRVFDLEIAGL